MAETYAARSPYTEQPPHQDPWTPEPDPYRVGNASEGGRVELPADAAEEATEQQDSAAEEARENAYGALRASDQSSVVSSQEVTAVATPGAPTGPTGPVYPPAAPQPWGDRPEPWPIAPSPPNEGGRIPVP